MIDAERARVSRVPDDAPWHHDAGIVVKVRVANPERAEDLLVRIHRERLAGRPLDDLGEKHVARVAVQEFSAGPEVQRVLPGDELQQFPVAEDVLVRPARKGE